MPDLWMDVDAALSEVPVNLVPLIDNTDFKTREEAVAYNATGLELIWHFTKTDGTTTATVVTPTSGGDYDWAHQDGGLYTIEMPASGGASINNDTEGFGWFTGVATGVLPWRGPVIGFRASGLNDLLIDNAFSATRGLSGTALPAAAADAAGGLPVSDAGGLDLDAVKAKTDLIPASPAAVGSAMTLTSAYDAAKTAGDATAANQATIAAYIDTEVAAIKAKTDLIPAAPAATGDIPTAASIADAIWDEAIAGHTGSGSTGEALSGASAPSAASVADAVWDEAISGHAAAGSAGKAVADVLDDTGTSGVVVASGAKSGYSLASTGLDSIATTAPSGVASNFREMVVAVWRRLFKKVTMTSSEIKTFADDGTTVLTTQTAAADGTTETQGAAT